MSGVASCIVYGKEAQRTISLLEGIGEQVGRLSIGDTQGEQNKLCPTKK